MWRCTRCETKNDDQDRFCIICHGQREEIESDDAEYATERIRKAQRDYAYDCAMEMAVNAHAERAALDEELTHYCETDTTCARRENSEKNEQAFRWAYAGEYPGEISQSAYLAAAGMFKAIGDEEADMRAEQCIKLAKLAKKKADAENEKPDSTEDKTNWLHRHAKAIAACAYVCLVMVYMSLNADLPYNPIGYLSGMIHGDSTITASSTSKPTTGATAKATARQNTKPTSVPTVEPTTKQTTKPTTKPTSVPTVKPTTKPTTKPTATVTLPDYNYEDVEYDRKKGDSDDVVKKIQKRLIKLGYLDDKADGEYGNKTKAAVKAFQQNNGIHGDSSSYGVATTMTQAVLFSDEARDVADPPRLSNWTINSNPYDIYRSELIGEDDTTYLHFTFENNNQKRSVVAYVIRWFLGDSNNRVVKFGKNYTSYQSYHWRNYTPFVEPGETFTQDIKVPSEMVLALSRADTLGWTITEVVYDNGEVYMDYDASKIDYEIPAYRIELD